MPSYSFECQKCGEQRHEVLSLAEHDDAIFVHCKKPMFQVFGVPQVVKDIEPYQAMGTDVATGKAPRIGSRREHREYLRRNNYREVGNEPIQKPKIIDVPDSHRDIKRTLDQFRSEGRWK